MWKSGERKEKQPLISELECEGKPLEPKSTHVEIKFSVFTAATMRYYFFDVTPRSLL
jgi:hypothetical protein